ncbi:hypothetical protein [Micromonospora sp. NPDC005254]|uniref:hypothetical protein n=1 Tax=Micromonospora sp. NPDC005254 TaxID=3364229 RepID=UPI00367D32FC
MVRVPGWSRQVIISRRGATGNPAAVRAGDLFQVTRAARIQFSRPILFRVIRVLDWPTYDGWVWLDGYEVGPRLDAIARRSIVVRPAGLLPVAPVIPSRSRGR